ncbi:GTPase Era [Candidatus Nomurabacteria bacterium]|nr:GTPase Era [Candidatus Nomurabacteria bacterium]
MKSGFVVLVGRSNVGKSTLLNTLVGTKIAATSFRAQMTRNIIHGVLNTPQGQAVFVDTPGVLKAKKSELTAKLLKRVEEALSEIDVVVYVVDPTREIGDEERFVLGLVRKIQKPKILVINKSDLPPQERKHQLEYEVFQEDFDAVFHLSALKGAHVQPLRDKVIDLLPEGHELYLDGQLTNVDNYFFMEEIIREKAFSVLEKEVPYSLTVTVDNVEDEGGLLRVEARILTDADRYKSMIIGKRGAKIKEIGQMARKELEQATNKKIYLALEVEVDQHWVQRV